MWRNFRKITFIILGLISIFILLSACGGQQESQQSAQQPLNPSSSKESTEESAKVNGKILVYTTIYPLYDFAAKIGGDQAEVVVMVPPGVESHDFEPKPKDVAQLNKANIFIYNGSNFEPWAEDVLQAINTTNLNVVNVSDHVEILDNDPHVWLDPLRAKDMARAIKEAFVQADPGNQDVYEVNYNQVVAELDKLDKEYQQGLENVMSRDIIVSHEAFGYLANRYNLKQIPIAGLSPSDEPSQKELAEIISYAKEKNIKYIFFETLVSGKVAKMVQEQIGAEPLTLNPLEGLTKEEQAQGKDYFSVMRENLENLTKALGQ
ncbi:metal ABC transporter substrate-binding protein [Microaerobacter geothermalis]|uniref:metal ABC transporter substrate-binding protein n=1 Tax=Microaerobacter geothermalis TaxID=674972 RepID=UPI001F2CF6FA|nr:metal ABC transporter substrate-binding protein [Microaerobacter geothermalis]MCF6093404.1 metal ABC transporter substrate-binding protein [Microaerobacter geothermalis]